MTIQGYDLVGDIHGHADALHRLLHKLDYTQVEGVFRHSQRKMIFVGDFIDRGPEQREVLRIARAMCEAGVASAVMGNHEFNAIGWAAKNTDGKFLRSHSEKNASQHARFLRQIEESSADHKDALSWFRSLPIWFSTKATILPIGEASVSRINSSGRASKSNGTLKTGSLFSKKTNPTFPKVNARSITPKMARFISVSLPI
jgi:hypothetical protein